MACACCTRIAKVSAVSGMCPVCTNKGPPPSPPFSQVFILKGVKVLCFDTLLQVLILKDVRRKHNSCAKLAHLSPGDGAGGISGGGRLPPWGMILPLERKSGRGLPQARRRFLRDLR